MIQSADRKGTDQTVGAPADLGFRCQYMPEDTFLYGTALYGSRQVGYQYKYFFLFVYKNICSGYSSVKLLMTTIYFPGVIRKILTLPLWKKSFIMSCEWVTCWVKISADKILYYFFLFFPKFRLWHFMHTASWWDNLISMKSQSLFSGKTRKTSAICHLLNLPRDWSQFLLFKFSRYLWTLTTIIWESIYIFQTGSIIYWILSVFNAILLDLISFLRFSRISWVMKLCCRRIIYRIFFLKNNHIKAKIKDNNLRHQLGDMHIAATY